MLVLVANMLIGQVSSEGAGSQRTSSASLDAWMEANAQVETVEGAEVGALFLKRCKTCVYVSCCEMDDNVFPFPLLLVLFHIFVSFFIHASS